MTALQAVLAGLAVCSPPLVLGFERGNCDLIILLLIIGALLALRRGRLTGAFTGLFFAFALKLYPLAGFVCFLRLGWRRALPWLAGALVLGGVYIFWRWKEILEVTHNTPSDALMAFGSTHVLLVLKDLALTWTGKVYPFQELNRHLIAWAAVLFMGAIWTANSKRRPELSTRDEPYPELDGFRVGACIYALTFIAGTSYVYRQMFLLLCLPWLWSQGNVLHASLRLRKATLVLILLVLWLNPYWWSPLTIGSELSSWALLAVLGWHLGATMPQKHQETGV